MRVRERISQNGPTPRTWNVKPPPCIRRSALISRSDARRAPQAWACRPKTSGVLAERFDWDMKALVRSKRQQGERLPEALESFRADEEASAEVAEPAHADSSDDEETADRRAAILNREVQIGQRVTDFLDANERAGGHTLAVHVGQGTEFLESRAKSLSTGEASAFFDRVHAEAALSKTLSDHEWSNAIDSWLEGNRPDSKRLVIRANVSDAVGIVVDKSGEVHPPSRMLVVLRRVDDSYRIHTAYLDRNRDDT
ncbi:MAG TPA: RNase A-like domain-containing protein [Solirubrobacteraceae bacterium]